MRTIIDSFAKSPVPWLYSMATVAMTISASIELGAGAGLKTFGIYCIVACVYFVIKGFFSKPFNLFQ